MPFSDSSSDDEQTSIFQAVCDPTFSKHYNCQSNDSQQLQEKLSLSKTLENPTGDKKLDASILHLKRNVSNAENLCVGYLQCKKDASLVSSTSATTISHNASCAVPYLIRRMSEIISRQVYIRELPPKLVENPKLVSGTHLTCMSGHDCSTTLHSTVCKDRLLLLKDVTYDPCGPSQHSVTTSNKWIADWKLRHGYTCCTSDTECDLKERCLDVALPWNLLAKGCFRSAYAEHRNTNPKKLKRFRLCGSKSAEGILYVSSSESSVVQAQFNKPVKCHPFRNGPELQKDSQQNTYVESDEQRQTAAVKRKKNKSRKRGLKKKPSNIVKAITGASGSCVTCCEDVALS